MWGELAARVVPRPGPIRRGDYASLTDRVLDDVNGERCRQDLKWGVQRHPDGVGSEEAPWTCRLDGLDNAGVESAARESCEWAAARGEVTWALIAVEEFAEAMACDTHEDLAVELTQLAAVVVAWLEDLEERRLAALAALSGDDVDAVVEAAAGLRCAVSSEPGWAA